MKLWPTTTENKCFVKMLWHLLGEYVKGTILLICSICTIHRFLFFIFYFYFFPVIDLCSFFYSIFALFIYSSILVSHFVFFFLSLLFVLFFPFYIYHFTSSVFALWVYCSCNSALVSWVPPFFFLFNNRFVYFFSFKYWCKLTFILLYWHNKFHNIFTIIDVSISYIQVEIK